MPKFTKDIIKFVVKDFLECIKFKFVFGSIIAGIFITLIISLVTIISHQSYEILLNLSFEVVIFSFCFMIFGVYITRKVNLKYIRKIADVEPQKYYNFLISKFLVLLIFVCLFVIVNLLVIILFLSRDNLVNEVLLESIFYAFIYWFIPYMSCGLIGVSLGVLNHRTGGVVFIGIIFCIIVSPFNFFVFEYISKFFESFNYDLISNFFNKSIETLSIMPEFKIPFNSINPYAIDKVKWLDNLVIFISTILFFHFILMFEFEDNERRNYIGFGILSAAIAFFIIYINYPKDLFEMLNKEELNDKVYYNSSSEDLLNFEGDTFTVDNYDIILNSDDVLYLETKMEIEALDDDVKNLCFVFYHGFNINDIRINNSDNFKYKFENDMLKIKLERPVDNGDILNMSIKYSGIGSETFINYKNEIVLPSYFPWVPRAFLNEYNGYIETEYGDIPASIEYKSNYKLTYNGENEIYTNLSMNSENFWSGESLNGITVIKGKLDESVSDGLRSVFPKYEVGIKEYTNDFSKEIIRELSEQKENFGINNDSDIKDVFYLPMENLNDTNILMDMEDHIIVSLKRSYSKRYYEEKSFEELNNFTYMALESILTGYTRSNLEYKEKKQVFVEMYEYYDKLNNSSKVNKIDDNYSEMIEDEYNELTDMKDFYEENKIENEYKLKTEAIEFKKEIKNFIDDKMENKENSILVKLFNNYYKILTKNKSDFTKIEDYLSENK